MANQTKVDFNCKNKRTNPHIKTWIFSKYLIN